MNENRNLNIDKNEEGMATLEAIPLLICFLVLISHAFGFYGIIQTGILNSIAARTYAFETFRHRSNLHFFRENRFRRSTHYFTSNNRIHGINAAGSNAQGSVATERQLAIGMTVADEGRTNATIHNNQIYNISEGARNGTTSTSPAWIMVSYGICLSAECGD